MRTITDFYKHPYVQSSEYGDLVIFNYRRECTYNNAWDEITRAARGIIFNRVTGEIVSRPWPKFHNIEEYEFSKIPNLPFTVTTKLDGSLGISYFYNGEYAIATKGSFSSEQALWATNWLRANINQKNLNKKYTYLFEIIYKENKIVISYGDYEGLTLLGCIETSTGIELPYSLLYAEATRIGTKVVEQETRFKSINDLYLFCKKLPHNLEGFVVTFSSGLKIKIKGIEYLRIHKLISRMTPLAFWEAWDIRTKDVPLEYMAGLPEEFRDTCDSLHQQICDLHRKPFEEATQQFEEMKRMLGSSFDKKSFAIKAKEAYPKTFSYLMSLYNGKPEEAWETIHKRVRPTGNVMPEGIAGVDRLKRIFQEGL